MQPVTGVTVW